jgi:hypothetical protein
MAKAKKVVRRAWSKDDIRTMKTMVLAAELDAEIRRADQPPRRQVADRDPARQICHARRCLDVVRREHRSTESQIALLAIAEDARESLKAFGEKRKPSWPGK